MLEPTVGQIATQLSVSDEQLRLVLQVLRAGAAPKEPLADWEAYALLAFAFLSKFISNTSNLAVVLTQLADNFKSLAPYNPNNPFRFTPIVLTNGNMLEMGGDTANGKKSFRKIYDLTTGELAPQSALSRPPIWSVIFNPQTAYFRTYSSDLGLDRSSH